MCDSICKSSTIAYIYEAGRYMAVIFVYLFALPDVLAIHVHVVVRELPRERRVPVARYRV